jgi:ADP-heptose:LPS heptosyltransferase
MRKTSRTLRRQLMIRPGAIGDYLLSSPVLEYLQKQFTGGTTEVWVPSAIQPLVQFSASDSIARTGLDWLGLEDVAPPDGLIERLKSFDSIVSWYGAARPDFRSAVESLQLPFMFHAALPDTGTTRQATDFFATQVGAPLGLIPRIQVPEVPRRQTVVIHPFSGSRKKNWSLKNFQELASRLPLQVEWCAGPEEPLPDANRFDNLLELAAWLKGARLYIGNDSGISHLAAATGMPTFVLFGPTDPAIWAPRGANVWVKRSEPLQDLESAALLPEILRLLE